MSPARSAIGASSPLSLRTADIASDAQSRFDPVRILVGLTNVRMCSTL